MSQKTSVEEEIDGVNFSIFMLPPREAVDTLTDLGHILGPSFSLISDLDNVDNQDLMAKGFQLFFQNYNSAKGHAIIDRLASKSYANNLELRKKENFDTVFTGKTGLLFKWLVFAVKAQYADFFSSMGDVLGSPIQAAGKTQQA